MSTINTVYQTVEINRKLYIIASMYEQDGSYIDSYMAHTIECEDYQPCLN
jgi:hypothetical protein